MNVAAALGPLLLATSSSKPTSSGSSVTFVVILVVIGVVGYFFLLRPQQQKARRQRAEQSAIEVGDEIVTVGGIVGTVLDIDSERVTVLTGLDGGGGQPTRLVLVRNAVARKIEPTAPSEVGEAGDADGTAAPGTSTNGAAGRPAGHPGYGGLPDETEEDGGEAMQGGKAQAEQHEGADGRPEEDGEP
jgi:preprotein translocase subunit YajC